MSARFCPSCGAAVVASAAFCTRCGATLAAELGPAPAVGPAPSYAPPGAPTPYPPQAYGPAGYAPPTKARVTQGTAIAGLLLNILLWPGLGSLVAGRNVGWAQGFLFLAGIPLSLVLIGIPLLIGAWVWSLVTGIQLVQEAGAP